MVSEQTREEDEKLREKLRHVDLAKLRKVIKVLVKHPPPDKKRRDAQLQG